MASIDEYIFGYRTVRAEEGSEPRLATAFIRLGISARELPDGSFLVREGDVKALRKYVGGRVRCSFGEPSGLPDAIRRQRYYILPLISFIISLIMTVLLTSLVWDVRIETDGNLDRERLREILGDVGLRVGMSWSDIDVEHTENAFLLACDDAAWVQINREGTVALVEIREKQGGKGGDASPPFCSNIVAARDGVIEEITVSGGVAVVRPGDTVKAGDILISGIVTSEAGVRFERARGTVTAHTADSISSSALLTEYTESTEVGELVSLSVVILGKTINIFKNYGNLTDDCVIIEDEELYLLDGDVRLPFSVKREYLSHRVVGSVSYDSADLPGIAGERLNELLRLALSGADLVKLRTTGEYTGDGYVLTAEYVKAESIGREVEIDLVG